VDFHRLDEAGIDGRGYAGRFRMIGFRSYNGLFRRETRPHLLNLENLMADLASGKLPPFAFIVVSPCAPCAMQFADTGGL
jgi:hypothetical protein